MNGIKILIIRGASGVGKTTLLKELRTLQKGTFCVDIDDIRSMLSDMDWYHGFDDYVNSQRITTAMLKEMAKLDYKRAIVVDSFPSNLLHSFMMNFSFNCRIVSLYCRNEELHRRLRQRGKEIYRIENILALNESIRMHDLDDLPLPSQDKLYVDNSDMTITQLAQLLLCWQ